MISKAKIVLNGAVDMAGKDRGNMRCFEAMGCGALMVSDDGNYPDGMTNGQSMLLYKGEHDVVEIVQDALIEFDQMRAVQRKSYDLVRKHYGKELQWVAFQDLISRL